MVALESLGSLVTLVSFFWARIKGVTFAWDLLRLTKPLITTLRSERGRRHEFVVIRRSSLDLTHLDERPPYAFVTLELLNISVLPLSVIRLDGKLRVNDRLLLTQLEQRGDITGLPHGRDQALTIRQFLDDEGVAQLREANRSLRISFGELTVTMCAHDPGVLKRNREFRLHIFPGTLTFIPRTPGSGHWVGINTRIEFEHPTTDAGSPTGS